MLDITIKEENIEKLENQHDRITVRAIVIRDGKLLVVHPKNERMYGTPGGGIDPLESLEDAVKRELKEETGAYGIEVMEYIGKTEEFRSSKLYENTIFHPISHYFLVRVQGFGTTDLEPYETELELTSSFQDIDFLISENEASLEDSTDRFRFFYETQLMVFHWIKKYLMQ